MVKWKIGCSGYHYAEWKGMFYPEDLSKNKWFDFYCQHFNTIELNVTFYKFPRVALLKNWYTRSPQDFTFSVKAPRLITHYKKFKDSQRYLSDFYTAVKDGLQEKAGCILFQFPANFYFDEGKLERILAVLDRSFSNVVEFRHPGWWQEKVFQAMTEHGVTFSGMSHPTLPQDVIAVTDTVYYRFHGVPHLYISKYESEMLERIVSEIQHLSNVRQAYLYFNNTADGAAIVNASQSQQITELVHDK